jgi:hypothetical protein
VKTSPADIPSGQSKRKLSHEELFQLYKVADDPKVPLGATFPHDPQKSSYRE